MADFDQLIKDKIDQTEYSYKHSAWKGFAKRAGIKAGLSGLQIAAIVISAVVVLTGVTLGILFLGHPTTNDEQGMGDMAQDTVETRHDTLLQQDNTEAVPVEPEQVDSSVPNSQSPKTSGRQPAANGQRQTVNGQQPTANSQRPQYGPPLEILVDTITQMEPTDEQLRNGNSRIF